MNGHAYVFLRKSGAPLPPGCAGHVGWAFEQQDGGLYGGATENPSGNGLILPGGDTGWWGKPFANEGALIAEFRERAYNGYKVASVPNCVPAAARHTADESRNWGYTAVGNNCLDHVWRVLAAYGELGLPWTQNHPSPNDWFAAFNGEYHNV